MHDLPFNLRAGEEIIKDIKPVAKLKNYFTCQTVLLFVFFGGMMVFVPFLGITSELYFNSDPNLGVSRLTLTTMFLSVVLIGFSIFAIWLSHKRYQQSHYWITNKRVIYKRGALGYKITSIPYERISDVIISRTFFENLFGISSLHIQTLAGQISQGSGGSEGNLAGIPNPEETQELILENVEKSHSGNV